MKRLLLIGLVLALLLPGGAGATGRGFQRGTESPEAGESRGFLRGTESPEAGETGEGRGFLRGTEAAAPDGTQHLLWDIPFGTPAEEVAALVKEKTGLVLEEGYDQWGGAALVTAAIPQVEMLGQPVRLTFGMDETNRLENITVNFQTADSEAMAFTSFSTSEDAEQVLYDFVGASYAGIHEALVQRYGQPEGGVLALGEETSDDPALFNYPGGAEGPDLRQYAQAAADSPQSGIITRYGNVYEVMVVLQQPEMLTGRSDLMRAEMYLMLILLADGEDFSELMDDVLEINGFETERGVYAGKVVQLEL